MEPSKIIFKEDVLKDALYVFEAIEESRDCLEFGGVFLQGASKAVDVPVSNDGSEDMLYIDSVHLSNTT